MGPGDAIKLKHFINEELIAEVKVDSTKDVFWRTPDRGPVFSAHLFNGTADDYVVRVYKVIRSVALPKVKK
jgi:hypothetical protein